MAQLWAKGFYNSGHWKRCRDGYIKERIRIDGGLCEVCRERLGYIVHHEIILTSENIKDPDVSLNWKYLSYECKPCHDLHEGHGVSRSAEPVCVFDDDGNPIGILPEYEHDRL
jgi:hypothetical protein